MVPQKTEGFLSLKPPTHPSCGTSRLRFFKACILTTVSYPQCKNVFFFTHGATAVCRRHVPPPPAFGPVATGDLNNTPMHVHVYPLAPFIWPGGDEHGTGWSSEGYRGKGEKDFKSTAVAAEARSVPAQEGFALSKEAEAFFNYLLREG